MASVTVDAEKLVEQIDDALTMLYGNGDIRFGHESDRALREGGEALAALADAVERLRAELAIVDAEKLTERLRDAGDWQRANLRKPWICPRCGTVNAWWVARCKCKPDAVAERDA